LAYSGAHSADTGADVSTYRTHTVAKCSNGPAYSHPDSSHTGAGDAYSMAHRGAHSGTHHAYSSSHSSAHTIPDADPHGCTEEVREDGYPDGDVGRG